MTDTAGCELTAGAWYSRQDVVKYFQLARAAMNSEDGSIFLLDMLGGHAGLSYLWEQAKYDPVKRQLTCHISLKNPQTSQVNYLSAASIPDWLLLWQAGHHAAQ